MEKIYDKSLAILMEAQTKFEVLKKVREQQIKDSLAQVDTTHYVRKIVKLKKKQEFNLKKVWPTPW